MSPEEVNRAFGNIDLFLLDQLLKGNFNNRRILLDAGCGEGRNIKYFISRGLEVYGIDTSPAAIRMAGMVFRQGATFKKAAIEDQPFAEDYFEAILCINVLHHCRNEEQFIKMWRALVNMLKPGGILFIRTLIKTGGPVEKNLFLLSEELLEKLIAKHQLRWIGPLKKEVMSDGKALGVVVLTK
jgi:tellurite methyltransferase